MATDMIAATWDQQGFVVYSSALKSVGDQAGEDLERPDPARLRAARGPRRDQPAGDPARLVHHAGQGQPGRARGGRHRRVPRDGQRLRRHARRPQRPAPAQRLRAARRASRSIESQHLLYNVSMLLRTKCVDGITVNEKVLEHYMETTVGIVTALNPVLGYDKATELADEALQERQGHPRGHSREEGPDRGADQGAARSDQADQPRPEHLSRSERSQTPIGRRS